MTQKFDVAPSRTYFGQVARLTQTLTRALAILLLTAPAAAAAGPPSDDELTGRVDPSQRPVLVRDGSGWLHRDVAERYAQLVACARDPACSGLARPLRIATCSRFRSFRYQKWRFTRQLALRQRYVGDVARSLESTWRYLALPGTSRHHWGTDIDLSWDGECTMSNHQYMSAEENVARCARKRDRCLSTELPRAKERCRGEAACGKAERRAERLCAARERNCYKRDGRGLRFYRWLDANAGRFGFCQPYKDDPERRSAGRFTRGYERERWHWSDCCEAKRELDAYRKRLDALAPTLEDTFGGRALANRKLRPELERLYREVVLPSYRDHVLNIHADCVTCARDCGVREARTRRDGGPGAREMALPRTPTP